MFLARSALASLAALAAGPALACYTVYDAANRIVYRAQTPPVDMSQPLSQAVPAAFPGGHLVFGHEPDCPRLNIGPLPHVPVPSSTGRSPLLTDRATAASMGLPHSVLPSGAVLVRERPEGMRPGITVVDPDRPGRPGAAPPDTRALGAAPGPSAPRR